MLPLVCPTEGVPADVAVFLNLTAWGRYRVNVDARISLELVTDLFWDISQIYYRFDSDPSVTASSTNDYGIVTGVRYDL